ncbi:MAG: hypothetical protein ABI831_07150 [Betaproteobacteria bacterium]
MRHFKVKQVCLAVGSAFAVGIAAQAHAGTPVANGANALDGFVAGSTAFEPALRAYMRSICATTVEEFQVAAVTQTGDAIYGTGTSNQKAIMWQCSTLTTAIGSSTSLTLRKSSGDSGEGVTGVSNFYPVNFISTANAAAVAGFACGSVSSTAAETGLSAMNQQTCSYSTSTGSAYIAATNGLAGMADVEPSILNTAIGAVVPSFSNVSITNIAAAIWGVPVTKTFRDKLQGVQGLTVGSDTEANMPSLSKTALYSIFANVVSNADSFTDASNVGISTLAFAGSPASANGNRLYFLRRPESSGTMASFKAMFGNTPCTGTAGWAGDGSGISTCVAQTQTSAKATFTFQSTGNLISCLTTLNSGQRYGIGISASSQNPIPNNVAASDKGFRWIKVDGYAPTLFNAATGHYPYITEATFMTATSGPLAPSGDAITLLNNIRTGMRTPSIIAKVNADNTGGDQQYGGFKTGYVVTAAAGFAPTYPLSAANMDINPVIPGTRNTGSANSCQPVANFTSQKIPVNQQ